MGHPWSFFLIGHSYLTYIWLVCSKNGHEKDICYDAIQVCVKYIDLIFNTLIIPISVCYYSELCSAITPY